MDRRFEQRFDEMMDQAEVPPELLRGLLPRVGSDPFLSAHAAITVVVVSACFSRCFQRPAL